MIDIKPANDRGFLRGEFTDSYGEKCSIQISSSVEPRIWLGLSKIDKITINDTIQVGKYVIQHIPPNWSIHARMHLNIEQIKELIPHLQKFVDTNGEEI